MEGIDFACRSRAKTDMAAAALLHPRHVLAQIDPELRIGFAETNRRWSRHLPRKPKRRQRHFIEARGTLEVADADGDVVDHLSCLQSVPDTNTSFRDGPQGPDPESRDS